MTMTQNPEKLKALEAALAIIRKEFGNEALMKMGDKKIRMGDIGAIPTGILPLDIALGVGGVPRGRAIEIYGPESSGKTTISLGIVAQAQKAGGAAAYIDVEHALDPEYSKRLGVDVDNLLISQPNSGEEALGIAEKLAQSGAVDIIVLDSVAALVPRAEIEGEMGDAHMGLQARLMSQALRKLTSILAKTNTTMIFVNQLRLKIGVMFGNPETTPGGLALKFYSSVRIDVRAKEKLKVGDKVIGHRGVCKVIKNKVAPPFKQAEFEMIHGQGVPREACLLVEGENYKVIEKSGTWYLYGTERLGQGKDQSTTFLRENPKVADEIEGKVRKLAFAGEAPAEVPAPAEPPRIKAEKKAA